MAPAPFDECVFINCPFDETYDPILQAIIFCIVYLGLTPRIARERADSAEIRLDKIKTLIGESRYSIHDLSRSKAKKAGEFARHNMPFELGIDYGCRQFAEDHRAGKKFLVLSDHKYDYMSALSDLSGCDIETHAADRDVAVRKVRNWLVNEAVTRRDTSPGRITRKYADFQVWHYDRQQAAGFTDDDIREYPTKELFRAMIEWIAAGEPTLAGPTMPTTRP